MRDFIGKVALVTGGGSGIGRATALLFARRGAGVIVVDRNGVTAEETVAAIVDAGEWAMAIESDLSTERGVEQMMETALSDTDRIHVAFNNAGISSARSRFHEIASADWERMIATNLSSVFYCMKHELAHMLSMGGGAIVNTSSGAGVIAAPGQPHYTAAKHGVLGLTKVAAAEYAKDHIRVNAVCPGVVDTGMVRAYTANDPELEAALAATVPTGQLGRPEDVAESVVWLCSDAAAFVSGTSLFVDGASVCR